MDTLSLLNQVAAICRNVTGITTAFAPLDTPHSLNQEDLPAAVPFLGDGERDVDSNAGGRASCAVYEGQVVNIPVYLVPAGQGYDVGDLAEYSVPFVDAMLDAFDGRPRLVNATGNNKNDFVPANVGLDRAFIKSHRGVTVQPYGGVLYFAVTFTLTCDGRRSTSKVEGN